MKILFLVDNFPPEYNAPATRTFENCVEWVKKGHSVTVITCFPNFPAGKIYSGYKNKLFSRENLNGITIIRVWSFISANKGGIKRIIDYFSFAVTSFLAGLFIKTDIIVATSPQFFVTWTGCALSFFKRKPWVFELRDLWPESITAVGAMKKNFIIIFLEKVELFLYRRSSLIIALTDAFKRNLIQRGISENKIEVIPNGANLDLFIYKQKNKYLLDLYNLDKKFVIGYIGTHGMAHNLSFILEAASYITNKNKNIIFIFIGDGAEKINLKQKACDMNLTNVLFLDPIPKDMVPDYISIIDVSLVPLRRSNLFKSVIPSKIFESAAMRKPILLGVEGQAKEIIDKFSVGISYLPENLEDFIDKVDLLFSNKTLYDKFSSNCLEFARAYDRKLLADKMLENLLYLVN